MRTAAVCLVVTLTAPLSACIGLHSNQPVQQQYLLSLPPLAAAGAPDAAAAGAGSAAAGPTSAAASGPASAAAADTLQVLSPEAAPGLVSDGIAVLRPGQRLDYYTGARWVVSAPMMLQTLAIEALRRQGRFSLVEADGGPFAARYLLSVELTHFEADYTAEAGSGAGAGAAGGPTVHVSLVCTLGRRVGREVVTTLTVNSSAAADADRMGAVIAAFQQATGAALERLAREIVPVAAAAGTAAP